MKSKLVSLALGVVLPIVMLSTQAMAEIRPYTVKFAAANNKGHPQVMGMEKFAEIVKEKSDGKIDIKLFPGGVLGSDPQTLSALQGGVVEMTVLNAGILSSTIKEFGALDLPFLFNSGEEADKVMDGEFGTKLAQRLPDTGLIGLAYWELGFRNLSNNRHPVEKLEDIKGLKIRTLQSPVPVALFNALGANAVPLPYTELYTALETGTVDGQENPNANIINAKFYEVQKHLALTRHQYNPQLLMVSKKFWDKLNDEEKAIFEAAALEARDYQRSVARELDKNALDEIKKTGMQVTEFNVAEMQRLRDAVQPVVEQFTAEIGPETVNELFEQLKIIRAQQ